MFNISTLLYFFFCLICHLSVYIQFRFNKVTPLVLFGLCGKISIDFIGQICLHIRQIWYLIYHSSQCTYIDRKAYIWTRTIKLSIKLKGLCKIKYVSVALNSSCSVFEEFSRFLCLCAAHGYYKNLIMTNFFTKGSNDTFWTLSGCYKTQSQNGRLSPYFTFGRKLCVKQPHFTVDRFYENQFWWPSMCVF